MHSSFTVTPGTLLDLSPDNLRALGIAHAMDPHPQWETPDPEVIALLCGSAREVVEFLRPRHERIAQQLHDPLRYGWESPGFIRARKKIAEMRKRVPRGVITLATFGGNRPGKSEFWAKIVMETLTARPERAARCFQQSEAVSEVTQQRYVKRYLPPEWRPKGESKGLKTGGITNVRFSQKGGFSDNRFVLPNGSECEFCFYEGSLDSLQGGTFDIMWFDELVPAAWVEDQQFRLMDRNGLMGVSFTCIDGYTDTVAIFEDGGVKTEEIEAELLPQRDKDGAIIGYEKVPLVLSCRNEARGVVYFHTKENFYAPYEEMKQQLKQAAREKILMRAYGVCVGSKGARFTNFRDDVHILHEAGYARLLESAMDLTWDFIYDPAGSRNPFMQWWANTQSGQKILMREWPQPGDYIPGVGAESGVWAVTSAGGDDPNDRTKGHDGRRGPAQKTYPGYGTSDYVREMIRVERELALGIPADVAAKIRLKTGKAPRIVINRRMMDSRAYSGPNATSEESITTAQIYAELPVDAETGEELALDFEKASGRGSSDDGENWQHIVQMDLAVPADNDPRRAGFIPPIMFAHCCRNTIFAVKVWTGLDGQKGACKDPVDGVKYFVLSDPEYTPPPQENSRRDEWGGY